MTRHRHPDGEAPGSFCLSAWRPGSQRPSPRQARRRGRAGGEQRRGGQTGAGALAVGAGRRQLRREATWGGLRVPAVPLSCGSRDTPSRDLTEAQAGFSKAQLKKHECPFRPPGVCSLRPGALLTGLRTQVMPGWDTSCTRDPFDFRAFLPDGTISSSGGQGRTVLCTVRRPKARTSPKAVSTHRRTQTTRRKGA